MGQYNNNNSPWKNIMYKWRIENDERNMKHKLKVAAAAKCVLYCTQYIMKYTIYRQRMRGIKWGNTARTGGNIENNLTRNTHVHKQKDTGIGRKSECWRVYEQNKKKNINLILFFMGLFYIDKRTSNRYMSLVQFPVWSWFVRFE